MHHMTRIATYADDDGHSYQNVLPSEGNAPQWHTTRTGRVMELRMVFHVEIDAALTQAAA